MIALTLSWANTASAADGLDLTRPYLNAYGSDCAFGPAHVQALRKYKVLLVPGYLGDLNPTYFADQLRWLASKGVDHAKVAVTSGQSIVINGAIIATAIRASGKPVILLTHSKGAVDTLEALLSEPTLRTKVRGWISLQGPFFGSPVADKLLDGSFLNPLIATVILVFLGGTSESAQGLTTGASLSYYRTHAAAIGQLMRDVPALAFASVLDRPPGAAANTALAMPHELMSRDGIRSDGLVPFDSAVLPDMDFVKVSGIDHIAPVMPAQMQYERVRMTQGLLLLLPPFRGIPRDKGCQDRR